MKVLLYLLLLISPVKCFVPIEDFFPYGITNNEQVMPPSDDGSSPPQTLTVPFPFFDKLYPKVWVNVNGAISFDSPIPTFTPTCIPLNYSMIGPFWADIDTLDQMHGEGVYFGESLKAADLKQAESEVINAFPNLYGIKFKSVFIATWYNVTFFDSKKHPDEKRNTFQAAIATDGIHSFAIFYYNKITWTTGDASQGNNGLGGIPAQAGFDAGDSKNRLMLDGSCKNEIITIDNRSNVNFPGKWIFRVDSADIETAGCTTAFSPSNTLKISSSTVTTLGQVAVEISGPCFKATNTTVTCRIYDPAQAPYISVNGKIVGSSGSVKVICGIPYLFSIGRVKLELVVADDLAPISFFNTTYHGYFYVAELNPESNGLNLQVNKDANGTAANTTFTWAPTLFSNGTNFLTIQMIVFDLTKKSAENVIKIGEKIDNNGQWIWQHSNNGSDETAMVLSTICNNVFGKQLVFQAIEFGWDMMAGNVDYRSYWIVNSGIDANKFIGDFCSQSIRAQSCNEWYLTVENINSSSSQPCPPTAEQAAVDLRFIPQTSSSSAFYHPGEDICYESITPLENGEGQECCYKNGNIDCAFGNGGHSQATHSSDPFGHYANDALPWIMCCYDQDDAICGKFQSKRSCDPGDSYIPPGPAAAFGDPHLYTFDDLFYTFNGFGEFWILENSTSQPLAVQARMEPLNPASTNATIFSGFVFFAGESPKIQVQKSLIRIVDIFIDDEQLDIISPNSLRKLSIDGWKLIIANDYSNIQIGTNLGFSFKITTSNGAFGIEVSASPEWKSKTMGLFGNFNDDKSDDFTSQNGTVLDPASSSLKEIHQNFGLSWAVSPSTSLFTYFGGKSFADFNKFNYTPTFTFSTSAVSNSSQDMCKNDWGCLFDFYYTQNAALANFTYFSNQNYQNIVKIFNKTTQMCPSLIAPENGYLNVSNYFKDSTANFGCFTNYTINSNASFICDSSYQWSPTNWSLIVCNYNFAHSPSSSPSMMAFNFIVFSLALIFNYFVLF